MTKAELDNTLYILGKAERYLRLSRYPVPTAADIAAIAILEQAAREVLGVQQ